MPAREVSAVHISELLDPTGYLTGGELLLTTGLSLPRNKLGCERYVGRLAEAGLSALALGLGPVHTEIPAPLLAACRKLDLPLLLVPAPTPFLRITKAYWAAVSRSAEQHLKDVLATQRALVDAAASVDPVTMVLRTLSRSLDAWAAAFSPTGEIDQVVPASAAAEAERVRREIVRLEGAGAHSAASFSTGSAAVIVFPLAVREQAAGFLAVGTSAPLDSTRRRAVLTASALLSLDSVRRSRAESVADEGQRCVGLLVDFGYVEAARRLAGAVRAPSPPDHVRLLALRGRQSDILTTAVRGWCPETIALQTDRHTAWFLIPADHPPTTRLEDAVRRADPKTAAVLSDVVPVEQTAAVRAVVAATLGGLASGTRLLASASAGPYNAGLAARLAEASDRLTETQRQTLVDYLRHHGQWEAASRSLGVHRNTLRHRIARCEALLEVDLADPDVTAQLWLLLRRRGVA
ncbi:PucR family transcriptional regulator ligand-binding domain-containing protein [Streptomyces colonosanans]|uniref:PucR family transcriptional regulator ligand-binding domain-containing protein n=1 Tax=Streptomyces colonosanans TaxID=1428652 RepID=UPI001C430FCB|nr:PucR family transcriptional regulator ligand-binding domain-containing protein [Streptomyces colonosanans]